MGCGNSQMAVQSPTAIPSHKVSQPLARLAGIITNSCNETQRAVVSESDGMRFTYGSYDGNCGSSDSTYNSNPSQDATPEDATSASDSSCTLTFTDSVQSNFVPNVLRPKKKQNSNANLPKHPKMQSDRETQIQADPAILEEMKQWEVKVKFADGKCCVDGKEVDGRCPVCMDELDTVSKMVTKLWCCGGLMCTKCVQDQFQRKKFTNCALCNDDLANRVYILEELRSTCALDYSDNVYHEDCQICKNKLYEGVKNHHRDIIKLRCCKNLMHANCVAGYILRNTKSSDKEEACDKKVCCPDKNCKKLLWCENGMAGNDALNKPLIFLD